MRRLYIWLLGGLAVVAAAVVVVAIAVSYSDSDDDNDSVPITHVQAAIRSGDARVRSVNLGGWLVSEHWLSYGSSLFANVSDREVARRGDYGLMEYMGRTAGTAAFEKHRQTWINESHIAAIAAAGLNAVRVPVGFWMICDDDSDGYQYGGEAGCSKTDADADASSAQINMYARGSLKYLDALINDWGDQYNVSVMLSLHALDGSQNGYEHSAPAEAGKYDWLESDKHRSNSVLFATFLAKRYASSPAFLGMNLCNEPQFGWNSNLTYDTQLELLNNYYETAYTAVRGVSDCVLVLSPFIHQQDAINLRSLMNDTSKGYTNVWHELHPYFIWGFANWTEPEILDFITKYRDETLTVAAANTKNRLMLGEWSMGGPPDESGIYSNMTNFRELGRRQLEYFNEYATGGWAFWTWRHSDDSIGKRTGWSMRALVNSGELVLTGM